MKEHVLVIGVVKSGVAVARLLQWHGYDVTITDMNVIRELEELQTLGIHVFEKGHPEELKRENYALVVKNPRVKYTVPFVYYFMERKAKILTEVEIGYRYATKFKYGAVTGANGKTTTTTMLYEMLKYNHKAVVASNIDWPLSELALVYEDEEKDVALELSNFQLLGIEYLAPHASVACNLAPDHLDYMPSVKSYYESKICIYENCIENDRFLCNVDDATVMQYAQHIPCKVTNFSLTCQDVDLYRKDGTVYLHELALFEEKNFHVVSDYNLSDAMTASRMAYKLDVSVSDIQKVIAAFSSVEYRLEYTGEENGVKLYNDSKATDIHAVIAALNSLNKNIILFVGGHDKDISFEDLKQYDERVKLCVAFGEAGPQFQDISSCVQVVETMQEALDAAVANSKEQDIVLLSPTRSNYDQFPNYEVRGASFKEMVRKWLQAQA